MVRVIEGRFQYRNDLRGSKNYFEFTGGTSYRGFDRELPRVKVRGLNNGFSTVLNYFFQVQLAFLNGAFHLQKR